MKFGNDLKYLLSRSFGFDALLRLRASNGIYFEFLLHRVENRRSFWKLLYAKLY